MIIVTLERNGETQRSEHYSAYDAMTAALSMTNDAYRGERRTLQRRTNPDAEYTLGAVTMARDLWRPDMHGPLYVGDPYANLTLRVWSTEHNA